MIYLIGWLIGWLICGYIGAWLFFKAINNPGEADEFGLRLFILLGPACLLAGIAIWFPKIEIKRSWFSKRRYK